jgi:hypothetical protein
MTMIGRRTALSLGLSLSAGRALAVALPVPPGNALAFRMIRHGSEIGRHTLTFERRGDVLTVLVAVEAKVTLMSIPIVHYTHRATETWQGGALTSLESNTDKNGTLAWARGSRAGEGLVVEGSKTARYVAPAPAIATSYWNKRMLDGPMISMEDGVLLHPKVTARGPEQVRLASGGTIAADHYNITGSFDADVWYDQGGEWASFAVDAADGSHVFYERL